MTITADYPSFNSLHSSCWTVVDTLERTCRRNTLDPQWTASGVNSPEVSSDNASDRDMGRSYCGHFARAGNNEHCSRRYSLHGHVLPVRVVTASAPTGWGVMDRTCPYQTIQLGSHLRMHLRCQLRDGHSARFGRRPSRAPPKRQAGEHPRLRQIRGSAPLVPRRDVALSTDRRLARLVAWKTSRETRLKEDGEYL